MSGPGDRTVESGPGCGVDSPVHGLAAEVKVACALGFVVAVVATPREALWAFAVFAALVAAATRRARLPAPVLARRLSVEAPFVAFALLLPFVGSGPRTDVGPLSLSVSGCWAAWSILAKATLGASVAVVLSWSTPVPDLLAGLERLRVPRALTAIAGFMVRYLDLVADGLRRLQIARVSRGDDPRWLWQGRAAASTAGTMFVRTFERGERVQQAMLARGYTGSMPRTDLETTPARWWPAAVWPLAAWGVAGAALAGVGW